MMDGMQEWGVVFWFGVFFFCFKLRPSLEN